MKSSMSKSNVLLLTTLLALNTALAESSEAKWFKDHQDEDVPCSVWAETTLYDFQKLKKMDGDWRVRDSALGSIYFNFCRYANQDHC